MIYNRSARRIQGPPLSSHESGTASEEFGLYTPDQRTLVPSDELPLPRALRNEATANKEIFIRNRNRPEGAWVQVNGNPLRDKTGTVRGGVIVINDVTADRRIGAALRRATDALRAQMRTMEIVFNSISDGVVGGRWKGSLHPVQSGRRAHGRQGHDECGHGPMGGGIRHLLRRR